MGLVLTETSKGKPVIALSGYLYSLKKVTKISKNWQCTNVQCQGKLRTSLDGTVLIHDDTNHNHPSDEKSVKTNVLRQTCKRKEAEDPYERPRKKVIREVKKVECSGLLVNGIHPEYQAGDVDPQKEAPIKITNRPQGAIGCCF